MASQDRGTKTKADKSRILILFLFLIILVVGIVFAYMGLKKHQQVKQYSAAQLRGAPALESIPGAETSTDEYNKIQQKENLNKAQEAAERSKSASSAAIPTITRPALKGDSSDFEAKPNGAPRAGCSPEEVKRAKEAGVSASELRCKGCTAKDLQAFFTAAELRQAGFSAAELKAAGFSAAALKEAGFSAKELLDSGYTAGELKEAGYTVADLKAAGISLAELQKLGIDPAELRAAGFTVEELLAAGFPVVDLKKAGDNAKELKDAGASIKALSDAGFSPMDLVEVGATDSELIKANILPDKVKALRADIAAKTKLPKDCSIAALTQARANGVSATALAGLKCDAASLRAAGYTAAELRAAGFSAKDLRAAGFSAAELKAGGFNAAELRAAGFSAKDLKAAGFSASDLKAAGFNAQDLKDAGFSASELKSAGFTPAELRQAGYTAAELLKAGLTAAELRAAGYTAEQLKDAGLSAADLKAAGFTEGELVRAGFVAEEVNKPLITPEELERLRKAAASATAQQPAATSTPVAVPVGQAQSPAADLGTKISVVPGVDNNSDVEKVLEQLQKRQAEQISGEQQAEALQQMQTGMAGQAAELFASWNPPPTQQYVVGDRNDQDQKGGSKSGSSGGGKGNPGEKGAAGAVAANGNIIKGGTVMFAVLDTGINSDEVSPILATIVQGPLKGAKLMGQFSRTDKKVLLNFTTMNVKQLPTSISINAVAIDPDTARTAVASDVDSHYLQRYGTLFASSFLTGFAGAVSQSGSSIVPPTIAGNTIITQPPLTTKDKIAMALGAVGTQYSAEMSKNFSRPPTVTVEPGTALGILFMADLSMPKEVSIQEEKLVRLD